MHIENKDYVHSHQNAAAEALLHSGNVCFQEAKGLPQISVYLCEHDSDESADVVTAASTRRRTF